MQRKLLTLVICIAFLAAVAVGCAGTPAEESISAEANPSQSATISEEPAEAATETLAAPEEASEAPSEDATASAESEQPSDDTRTITDMAGREVQVPVEINKVLGTSPVGSIFAYTVAPEKLAAWNYAFNDMEFKYISDECKDLPVVGMGQNFNNEAVIEIAPDVILAIGGTKGNAIEQADQLQEQTNIPVVVYSMEFADTPETLRALGTLLGVEERAEQLAVYSETAIQNAQQKASEVAEADRCTVYYGNGPESLNTAPQGSDAAEVFEMAGGINCAQIEVDSADGASERVDISKEQLLAWDPDVIFVNGEPKDNLSAHYAANAILNDPDYATLKAVQNKRVYGIPQTPFSWLDRPKADNRIIGLIWAGAMMYPDLYTDVDVTANTQQFYQDFYHVDLTPEDVAALPND